VVADQAHIEVIRISFRVQIRARIRRSKAATSPRFKNSGIMFQKAFLKKWDTKKF
jgi:hypothetical protein